MLTKTIKIPQQQVDEINKVLAAGEPDTQSDKDGTIYVFSVSFGNGYEVDIKVCNGDPPYIDPVLFLNGSDACILEPDAESIEGEYEFDHDGQKFVVIVEAE